MSNHILDPFRVIGRLVDYLLTEPAPPALPDLEGMSVPEHLVGKDFDIIDQQGRIIATTRRQYDPHTRAMVG